MNLKLILMVIAMLVMLWLVINIRISNIESDFNGLNNTKEFTQLTDIF